MTPKIRRTGMRGDMAYSCTYPCPAPGCGNSAIGYDRAPQAKFIGECKHNHLSVCDTRTNG